MSLSVGSLVTSSRQSYMLGDPRCGRTGLIISLAERHQNTVLGNERWTVLWSDGSCYVVYGYSLRAVEQEA